MNIHLQFYILYLQPAAHIVHIWQIYLHIACISFCILSMLYVMHILHIIYSFYILCILCELCRFCLFERFHVTFCTFLPKMSHDHWPHWNMHNVQEICSNIQKHMQENMLNMQEIHSNMQNTQKSYHVIFSIFLHIAICRICRIGIRHYYLADYHAFGSTLFSICRYDIDSGIGSDIGIRSYIVDDVQQVLQVMATAPKRCPDFSSESIYSVIFVPWKPFDLKSKRLRQTKENTWKWLSGQF